MYLKGKSVFHKFWYFLRTYILILRSFDLFLQGSLLIVILLQTNVLLLLRRDAQNGQTNRLVVDYVMMGAGGAEFLLGALLAWYGSVKRQFSLSFWLGVTSFVSLLVLVFPFAQSVPANVELCGGTTVTALFSLAPKQDTVFVLDDNATARTAFLVIAAILSTLTQICIWAHGLTYLDDHDPKNGPYFYGILISIRLSLGLSGQNWLRPGSLRDDWWVAHLSVSMLTFMFAVLYTLFPKRMAVQCDYPEETVEQEVIDTGLCASLKRLTQNRVLMQQTVALACLSTAVFGFVHYDVAYVQARFHVEALRQDPRTSRGLSDIFRALVIIFFVMIFRVRFSARRSDGVKANTASRVGGVVSIVVAAFFVVLASVGCGVDTIKGFEGGNYVQPSCSQQCGCASERYGFSPVCDLDSYETYFSPCNAGCMDFEDLNGILLYHNCSCAGGTQRAIRGACSLPSCRTAFSVYQIFYTIMLAVSGAAFLMQGMVILRAVRRCDKSIAMGLSMAIIGVLSFVIGHFIYMVISYVTCNYHIEGACILHGQSLWGVAAASAVAALLSAAISLYNSRVALRNEPTTEL